MTHHACDLVLGLFFTAFVSNTFDLHDYIGQQNAGNRCAALQDMRCFRGGAENAGRENEK